MILGTWIFNEWRHDVKVVNLNTFVSNFEFWILRTWIFKIPTLEQKLLFNKVMVQPNNFTTPTYFNAQITNRQTGILYIDYKGNAQIYACTILVFPLLYKPDLPPTKIIDPVN